MDYLDFDVEVSQGVAGAYEVTVLRSPAGEASAAMRLPFDHAGMQGRINALQAAMFRSGNLAQRAAAATPSPDAASPVVGEPSVIEFGRMLYDALFSGEVLGLLKVSQAKAKDSDQGLRLKLRCTAPDLALLPWEYLYDGEHGDFLSLSVTTPLVRYVPLPEPMEALEVEPPLRILGVVVSPDDLPELNTEHERVRLESAVDRLRSRGTVELVWLAGRTWRYLQAALRQGPWHVLHFIGHGGFDEARAEGFVVLADEEGHSQRLYATDLGRLLGDHDPLRVAVLNACEGARGNEADLFSSTATVLVQHGTPAVIAMQYEITDDAAIEFSRSFYEAVADGEPVDTSLGEARKGMAIAAPNSFEWGTPVLFTHAPDGVLFRVTKGGSAPAGAKPDAASSAVSMCFGRADKVAVHDLADRLHHVGVDVELLPAPSSDQPWDPALANALDGSRSCVLLLGAADQGPWERAEMRSVLERRTHDPAFRIVPVMLPGAHLPDLRGLPGFLGRLRWIDLRSGIESDAGLHDLASELSVADDDQPLAPLTDVNPFRGLEAFDEEHAEFFFGREALTQQLVEQLRGDRFLGVLGPSGSGKSSVVRAGLVPKLRGGALPGSDRWPIVVLRPGAHPLESLAAMLAPHIGGGDNPLAIRETILATLLQNDRGLHATVQTALATAPGDRRLVVIVDQFEEVFTLCRDGSERDRFVATLLDASAVGGGQTIVVVTMRADFFGRAAAIPGLAPQLGERDVLVAPMERDELRRTMVEPARRVGLRFEDGLVETILAELRGEAGALPLLQHTLLELWEGRQGGRLTNERYREIGGVQGAIANRAESVFASLTPDQQVAARRILLRLIEPGTGAEITRRRASMAELRPPGAESSDVDEVVQKLVDARLITTNRDETGDTLDLAHEALIKSWPRFQNWTEENRAGLRVHRRITEATAEWTAAQRDSSYLFRGPRLQEAVAWADANPGDPSATELEFVDASRTVAAAEGAARRRRIRVTIGSLVGVTAVLAVLTAIALLSWRTATTQGEVATRAENAARAAETAAQARYLVSEGARLAAAQPQLGLRLAVEGLAVANQLVPPVDLTSEVRAVALRGRTSTLGDGIDGLFVSPDGSTILVDRKDAPGEVRSGLDGHLILGLDRAIATVSFDSQPVNFSVASRDPGFTTASMRTAKPATVPSYAGSAATSRVMLITYEDGAHELRLIDGTLVHLANGLGGLHFSSEPTDPIFLAWYELGGIEVRRLSDGGLVRTIPKSLFSVAVSPDAHTRFWALQTDGPALLLDADGGEIREVSDSPQIRDDGGPDANLLVCFEFAPGEIWTRRDASVAGKLKETCNGIDSLVRFDANDRDLFQVWNSTAPTLYRLSDASVVRRLKPIDGASIQVLDASTGLVLVTRKTGADIRRDWGASKIAALPVAPFNVSVLPGHEWLLIDYQSQASAELRSAIDGRVALSLGEGVGARSFSPDGRLINVESGDRTSVIRLGAAPQVVPGLLRVYFGDPADTHYVAVREGTAEVRRLIDDGVTATLQGFTQGVLWGPGWVYVDLGDHAALVRLADGVSFPIPGPNRPFTGNIGVPNRSPHFQLDGPWPGFVLSREWTSIWDLESSPVEVYRSELGETLTALGPGLDRFATVTADGRGYFVDMSWLRHIGGVGSTLNAADMIRESCAGPLAGFSSAKLAPFLGEAAPVACGGS